MAATHQTASREGAAEEGQIRCRRTIGHGHSSPVRLDGLFKLTTNTSRKRSASYTFHVDISHSPKLPSSKFVDPCRSCPLGSRIVRIASSCAVKALLPTRLDWWLERPSINGSMVSAEPAKTSSMKDELVLGVLSDRLAEYRKLVVPSLKIEIADMLEDCLRCMFEHSLG
jgi:hypothetical protein